MKKAVWIKADGEQIDVQPRNGKTFELDELQAFVGGYIEILYIKNNKFMVVNEEGKLNGLDVNAIGTHIWNDHSDVPHAFDPVVGDVLVCSRSMID